DGELSGALTTDLQASLAPAQPASETGRAFRISGRLAARDFALVCPSRLGNDRLALAELELSGELSSDGATVRTDQLVVKSDVGELTATGAFPTSRFEASGDRPDSSVDAHDAPFELK